eukprot:TRINITY_DN5150_c0_g1_i1.p1 TRINITY_DN5150_c0_g1~~TRINITY_DN5150_c0_g1_i1.p1  ORF type:complete len:965 (-),score=127.01 TRINITY_DN5150_c0_g1_i1:167-2821(-)
MDGDECDLESARVWCVDNSACVGLVVGCSLAIIFAIIAFVHSLTILNASYFKTYSQLSWANGYMSLWMLLVVIVIFVVICFILACSGIPCAYFEKAKPLTALFYAAIVLGLILLVLALGGFLGAKLADPFVVRSANELCQDPSNSEGDCTLKDPPPAASLGTQLLTSRVGAEYFLLSFDQDTRGRCDAVQSLCADPALVAANSCWCSGTARAVEEKADTAVSGSTAPVVRSGSFSFVASGVSNNSQVYTASNASLADGFSLQAADITKIESSSSSITSRRLSSTSSCQASESNIWTTTYQLTVASSQVTTLEQSAAEVESSHDGFLRFGNLLKGHLADVGVNTSDLEKCFELRTFKFEMVITTSEISTTQKPTLSLSTIATNANPLTSTTSTTRTATTTTTTTVTTETALTATTTTSTTVTTGTGTTITTTWTTLTMTTTTSSTTATGTTTTATTWTTLTTTTTTSSATVTSSTTSSTTVTTATGPTTTTTTSTTATTWTTLTTTTTTSWTTVTSSTTSSTTVTTATGPTTTTTSTTVTTWTALTTTTTTSSTVATSSISITSVTSTTTATTTTTTTSTTSTSFATSSTSTTSTSTTETTSTSSSTSATTTMILAFGRRLFGKDSLDSTRGPIHVDGVTPPSFLAYDVSAEANVVNVSGGKKEDWSLESPDGIAVAATRSLSAASDPLRGSYCFNWDSLNAWCFVAEGAVCPSTSRTPAPESLLRSSDPCGEQVTSRSVSLVAGQQAFLLALFWVMLLGLCLFCIGGCAFWLRKSPSLDSSSGASSATYRRRNLDIERSKESLDAGFLAAQDDVVMLLTDETPDQVKHAIYAFYKQATVGNVQGEEPEFWRGRERDRWNAWASVRGMSSDEAKIEYIRTAQSLK